MESILKMNGVDALKKDVALLFNRYDRDKDGNVKFPDFIREVRCV